MTRFTVMPSTYNNKYQCKGCRKPIGKGHLIAKSADDESTGWSHPTCLPALAEGLPVPEATTAPTALSSALEETLGGLDLKPSDALLVELTRAYVTEIEAGGRVALKDLGSKIVSNLEALQATPRSRVAAADDAPEVSE